MALQVRTDQVVDPARPQHEGYTAADMSVLEGLEPVRKRPGMYIGSTGTSGLHHLVWEVVDNSVDEAMAGYCDRIDVTILADGGCRVVDNGRGIPTDINRQHKLSGVEIALTRLHGGAKFGGKGYKVSGGLHGVGVSVVNALSSRLVVEVDRDGQRHRMTFRDGGKPASRLEVVGASPGNRTGTSVTFWPDARIFEETEFRAQSIVERLQIYAFLNAGLEIRFTDERDAGAGTIKYRYDGGIRDFARHLNASKEPLFKKVAYYRVTADDGEVEVALQWNTGYYEGLHGFANGISTAEGGTHVEGFKRALTTVVNKYARAKGHLKDKDDNLLGEDMREGLTSIVSVKLTDPQFEGQTKAKLGNTSIRSLVDRATNEKFAEWLEEHPAEGRQIVLKSVQAARARLAARQARDATRRKSPLEGAGMPGKLTDCRTRNSAEAELFIVEGDSAGGSAIRARNPENQAILPIRGKILNVEKARIDRMLKNNEIQALISAIGAGIGEEFDAAKTRYGKVIILADADVDGSHIRTLLLTFFFRQMRGLVEDAHVYCAQPPLFSTPVGKEKVYLKDEGARLRFLAEHPNHKQEFNRLKGLGEMDWHELGSTTMDRERRTLLRVDVEQAALADEVCSILMGDDVELRKHFITTNANDVRFLDI
ncbi:MAG TPA: DNA topoisomerase subunit B [Acidimicrobiales bacterium]|jgi:DNA gyrase subunit B|nr:DNA topoisomerase subunit B [Acidimicrobiales bacterium]